MNKKVIIGLSFINLLFSNSYSQETILITKNEVSFYEEYSVLKTNKKVKHGEYIRFKKPLLGKNTFDSLGSYSYGKRSGYWEFYYKGCNNIREKGFYHNDLKDSLWESFYPEGFDRELEEVKSESGIFIQVANAHPVLSSTGKYKNGRRVGVWSFFGNRGDSIQKYDYDRQILIPLKGQDLENVDAGFIGGDFILHQYLLDYFNFDEFFKKTNSKVIIQTSRVSFQFNVDENGRVREIQELKNTVVDKKFYARALATVQSLDGRWNPKKVNGIRQTVTKIIRFELIVKTNHQANVVDQNIYSHTYKEFYFDIKVEDKR